MKLVYLFSIWLLSSCSRPECGEYFHFYSSMANYSVDPERTNDGIEYDGPAHPSLIDQAFKEVEECLSDTLPLGEIPEDLRRVADCTVSVFHLPIRRECISVKIPDDWFWNQDKTEQLLPIPAPEELCQAKNLSGEGCYWRAGIQDNTIILTTPNLKLLKDPLIRIITGCNNPWADPRLSECVR